jgi:hypothetical protein
MGRNAKPCHILLQDETEWSRFTAKSPQMVLRASGLSLLAGDDYPARRLRTKLATSSCNVAA